LCRKVPGRIFSSFVCLAFSCAIKRRFHKGFPRSQNIYPELFSIGIALAKGTVAPDGSFRRIKNKPANLNMKKIEAIIRPFKLEEVQDALGEIGIDGMTVCEVKGFGRQNRHTENYRGSEYTVDFLPKIKIDLVVEDQNAEQAVNAIIKSSRTDKNGDGKVFISDIGEAVPFCTEEKEEIAV
jgi:nitrogen regulatory protein PII